MTLTFYDGLGYTVYCNCCPLSPFLPSFLLSFLPPSLPPPLLRASRLFPFFLFCIKNRSIILDVPLR